MKKVGKILGYFILFVAVVFVGAGIWFRIAPSDPTVWHTDPALAEPGPGRVVLKADGGDRAGPEFDMAPEAVLTQFDAIAMAEPRTTRLAGGPDKGRITYVSRSLVMGFPDYTTVEAVPTETGTQLIIHGRLRYGQSDMGVNSARVDRWLAQLGQG
ncbi:DUF1499 domain-containing protein [Actibacterium sp. 188UL27-1]|uniref:DUF1499 domain-containing protein n=1 Tax=Actibacterium sp. 188UL27-1 TaxID=2786961 RepID=UPI001958B2AB|nr:DUF1499 domain-containing protein [Actibacterium sp. 188UL27-1]MBM7067479.1 DUF1499 domain-containing protein [Actibacterium sp. 188UL27-1]